MCKSTVQLSQFFFPDSQSVMEIIAPEKEIRREQCKKIAIFGNNIAHGYKIPAIMAETKFKYRINELVDALPKAKNTGWVTEQLEKDGITQRTFFRDKSIELGDQEDISAERLLIYSKFFNVTLDELFNYTRRVKSAEDRKAS